MDDDRRKEREARRKARMEKSLNEEPSNDSSLNLRRRRRQVENEEISLNVPESVTNETVDESPANPIFDKEMEDDNNEEKIPENVDLIENQNENVLEETEIEFSNNNDADEKMETQEETFNVEIDEEINENMNESINEIDTVQIEEPIIIKKESITENKKGGRVKRKGLGGLSPEKKKLLRQLIMQKAAEEMKAEAKRRQEIKEQFLQDKVGDLNIENMNEAQIQILIKSLHLKIIALEGDKYDLELKTMRQTYEINEITIKINDGKGKFVKPVLKKVSKTETQLSRLTGKDEKNSIMDFRENLKSTGLNKYALEEKDDVNNHSKLEWRDNLKTTKEDEEYENETNKTKVSVNDEEINSDMEENVEINETIEVETIEECEFNENLDELQDEKLENLEEQMQEVVCEE